MTLRNISFLLICSVCGAEEAQRIPAELAPWQRVPLTARVAGLVERVLVDRGDTVKEGDLLVELSAPEMKAQIAEAEARAQAFEAQRAEADARRAAAQSTLDRLKSAAATPGAVAADEIVRSEKAVESLRALVVSLEKSAAAARAQTRPIEEMMSYLQIRAPFPGVITARYVHPGALASPTSGALLELEQVARLRLAVPVPEAAVPRIAPGSHISFTVAAWPGRIFSAAGARLTRSLDPKTRTMIVEYEVANPNLALAPGMYAEVALPRTK